MRMAGIHASASAAQESSRVRFQLGSLLAFDPSTGSTSGSTRIGAGAGRGGSNGSGIKAAHAASFSRSSSVSGRFADEDESPDASLHGGSMYGGGSAALESGPAGRLFVSPRVSGCQVLRAVDVLPKSSLLLLQHRLC